MRIAPQRKMPFITDLLIIILNLYKIVTVMKKLCAYLLLITGVISCAATHNTPQSLNPNIIEKPNIIYSFVDQNGNFYPHNWRKTYGTPPVNAKKNEYSLMKIATQKQIETQLTQSESSFLKTITQQIQYKKRVIIFIHGFNSTAKKSTQNYQLARAVMNINPTTDEIIQFYWDGLSSESLFGGAKIWFNATNFSQLAGEFGLRRILNTIKNKEIYILSHSRGASVALSALSSPPFSESIKTEILKDHNIDIDQSKNLLENNNKITCIMLAPAIGVNDFRMKETNKGISEFCNFSKQLQTIHITINNTDPLLKKFIGALSKTLKPTDLGYKEDAYNELCDYYTLFEKTDFTGQKSHDFDSYIKNPKFKAILKEYHLLK